jgi:hypothetical protein
LGARVWRHHLEILADFSSFRVSVCQAPTFLAVTFISSPATYRTSGMAVPWELRVVSDVILIVPRIFRKF